MSEKKELPSETRDRVAGPDRIRFKREELPGLGAELESMYNVMASVGREPSERARRLILWIQQEARIMNDPGYDIDAVCKTCGQERVE